MVFWLKEPEQMGNTKQDERCLKIMISLSFETSLLDATLQKARVFLSSHSSSRLLNQIQNCAEAQLGLFYFKAVYFHTWLSGICSFIISLVD